METLQLWVAVLMLAVLLAGCTTIGGGSSPRFNGYISTGVHKTF